MMEEKELSKLEKEFLNLQERLARTAHRHHKMLGQSRLLKILQEKKTASQRELVELSGVSPQSIGEALGKLERHGFITRTQDENDKRMVNVTLTEKGAAVDLAEKANCKHKHKESMTEMLFKNFSEEEKMVFAGLLERVNINYDEVIKNLHEKHGHGGKKCGCHGDGAHTHHSCHEHGEGAHEHHGCGCKGHHHHEI